MKDILFIGDSLIEFFDWAARFPGRRVFNLGVSGETVQWLLDRLDRITAAHPSVRAVFLMTGINNVALEEPDFMDDYGKVLDRLASAYPDARLYVNSLLPTLLPWITPEAITALNENLRALAEEREVRYIDIHSLFAEAGVRDCLLPDGVHLSEKGYAVWSDAVQEFMELESA
jgi:lysophospholipase L1-like esterase